MLKFNGPNVKLAFDIYNFDRSASAAKSVIGVFKKSEDDDNEENKDVNGKNTNIDDDEEEDESKIIMILKSDRDKIAITCRKVFRNFLNIFTNLLLIFFQIIET